MLLMTSRTPDPAPLVVPEAMSAGVIVAGYPAGGIPDMIADGRTGFLVETPSDLVARLLLLRDQPGEMARIRATAFDAVRQDYSLAAFHSRLAAIYAAMKS